MANDNFNGRHKMRPYGVKTIKHPDIIDVQFMGSKSSVGKFREKGGDFKSYNRGAISRAKARRFWKRKARNESKNIIANELKTLGY